MKRYDAWPGAHDDNDETGKYVLYDEAHAIELEREKLKTELDALKARRCESCINRHTTINDQVYCNYYSAYYQKHSCCDQWKPKTVIISDNPDADTDV